MHIHIFLKIRISKLILFFIIRNSIAFGLLFIFLINTSLGQTNYKTGKIISLNGDTLYGFIDDQNKLTNPGVVTFKENNKDIAYHFKPSDIIASIIDSGDFYLSAIIEIDMNYGQNINMKESHSKDSLLKKDTVFIRVLLQSKMSLFLYNDENNKNHYYYSDSINIYNELTFKKVPVDIDGKIYLKENTRYKNQLNYLMQDCQEAISKIKSTEYKENSLVELFRIYNNCISGNHIIYESLLIPNQNNYYLLVGLNRDQLVFKGFSSLGLENSNFSKSYNPLIGFGINIPFKRGRAKYSMFSELAWKKFDTRADYYSFIYYENNIHLQFSYLKLSSAFKYQFQNFSNKPYLFAGPILNYLIHFINTRHEYNHNPNLSPNYSREKDDIVNIPELKFGIGLFGGVGIRFKKLSLEMRYEKYSNFEKFVELITYTETFSFLIKYNLNK